MSRRTIVASIRTALSLTAALASVACTATRISTEDDALAGAWRSHVQFKTGSMASLKDLEFLYAFNAGGTMTESSNYDASPPVPPAYGVWRKTGPRQYEAKYVFFVTKAPKAFAEIAGGGGWLPGGSGTLVERITLSEDGKTYAASLRLDLLDSAGKPTESGSEADVRAVRIAF
jgi:hypothetical protein